MAENKRFRGGRSDTERWIRTFGFSAPLSGDDHIGIVAPATGTDEPSRASPALAAEAATLMPIGNGSLGAVSSGHFGGIGLNLMAAIPAPGEAVWLPEGEAPYHETNTGSPICR